MTAGYSATPLVRKLGYKAGMHVWFSAMPASVRTEIAPDHLGLRESAGAVAGLDAAHLFVTERHALEQLIALLRPTLAPTGFIWVSWPKKAARLPTDITEDVIRDVILPTGLVDVKVCAVDAIWSGLKLMIRRELR